MFERSRAFLPSDGSSLGRLAACLLAVFAFAAAGQAGGAEPQQAALPPIALATNEDWYPYAGAKDGKAVGFSVDLVRAAYAAVGVAVHIEAIPQLRCLADAERGALMACFSLGQRNALFLTGRLLQHKTPLFVMKPAVYVSAGSALNIVHNEDLRGKRVALTKDAHFGDDVEEFIRPTRVDSRNEVSSLRMLARGRVDLTMGDPRSISYLVQTHADEFTGRFKNASRPEGIASIQVYAAFTTKRPEAQRYADLLDEGLAIIKASGEYARIDARWSFVVPKRPAP